MELSRDREISAPPIRHLFCQEEAGGLALGEDADELEAIDRLANGRDLPDRQGLHVRDDRAVGGRWHGDDVDHERGGVVIAASRDCGFDNRIGIGLRGFAPGEEFRSLFAERMS